MKLIAWNFVAKLTTLLLQIVDTWVRFFGGGVWVEDV
jgi:hypothetical protein